ncbi:MAG: methyl-accepting chemotaxis protein, partial [Candidatus Omnitrophota bacterium]
IVGAIIALGGGFIFMYLSHRVGGALYRFEKSLETAANGDLSQRVTLRKTDELSNLKKSLNGFLENMDFRMSRLKAEAKKGLRDSGISHDGEGARKALENIKEMLEQFKTTK